MTNLFPRVKSIVFIKTRSQVKVTYGWCIRQLQKIYSPSGGQSAVGAAES